MTRPGLRRHDLEQSLALLGPLGTRRVGVPELGEHVVHRPVGVGHHDGFSVPLVQIGTVLNDVSESCCRLSATRRDDQMTH
jgi:hypothetical protein